MAQVDARGFNLSPNSATNLIGGFNTGQKLRNQFVRNQEAENAIDRQNQFRSLTQQVLDPSLSNEERLAAQRARSSVAPERAAEIDLATLKTDTTRRNSFLESTVQGAAEINAIPSVEGKLRFANQRIADLQARGIPSQETEEVRDLLLAGDAEGAQQLIDGVIKVGQQAGILKPDAEATGSKARTVQSSKLLPGGLVQLVYKNGDIETVPANEADEVLIKEAEDRGSKLQGDRASSREGGKGAAKIGLKAFDQVGKIRGNVAKLRSVVSLVGEGAQTGPITKAFPSFKAATVRLNQLQNELGLDVIGSVTFGALSEGELNLALETALPTNLDGPELVQWAKDKITAQEKLAKYMEEQSEFLLDGGSVPDWIRHKRSQNQPTNQPGSAQQVGGFSVEVVGE